MAVQGLRQGRQRARRSGQHDGTAGPAVRTWGRDARKHAEAGRVQGASVGEAQGVDVGVSENEAQADNLASQGAEVFAVSPPHCFLD